jgi:hypothetical protein
MKFRALFTYLYEFCPAATDLKVHSVCLLLAANSDNEVVIIDLGATSTQNCMMFQPPCPSRVVGPAKVYDSTRALTIRRYGAGYCFPVNRIQPNTPNADLCRIADWTIVGDNKMFVRPEFLARAQEHTTIEPICAEKGPLLVGLGNPLCDGIPSSTHGLEIAKQVHVVDRHIVFRFCFTGGFHGVVEEAF